MSALDEELEEGEISDSDSMEEEPKPQQTEKPGASQYSIFNCQSRATPKPRNIPQPPRSESDSSDSDEDGAYSDDEDCRKKRKFRGVQTNSDQSKTFVNPNFVNNGGKMPQMPKSSNRAIWGSILEEQILTSEIGNVTMEKKLPNDRDVESYDYSRAKDDDRPHPVEDEIKSVKEDLFGEVIDLEEVTIRQRRNLKRKHVAERLGKRSNNVRERLNLPKVTESSPVEDVTYFISYKLHETKTHLISKRVVQRLGRAKALNLLTQTQKVEASGGMMILNGSRRRTPGGVYLTLLKTDTSVTKEQLDEIFEEETKWSLELRKRKRAKARSRRKKQDVQNKSRTAAEERKGDKPGSMEMVEDNSRSSVEGQTGSPKNHADHLSDAQESVGAKEQDSARSNSEDGKDDADEDFDSLLARHRSAAKETKEPSADGDADAITLDDVLDLGVDDYDID